MERPESHIIDTLGQTQLRSALEPLGWTLTEVRTDYGVDFDVEVFRDNKTTGITFKVQLKSSRSTDYSAARDFVSESLGLRNARYLIHEMQVPTVLIHADVENQRTFWTVPQLDQSASAKAGEGVTDSVTIRLPVENALPETVDSLLEAVGRAKILIATRSIVDATLPDFTATLRAQPDIDAILRDVKQKFDALRHERAFQQFWAGQFDEAEASITGLLADPQTDLDIKFAAAVILEQVELRRAIQEGRSDEFRGNIGLAAADRLRALTDHGPAHLRLYAVMTRKVAELSVLVHESWGLWMNFDITRRRGGDPLWEVQLMFRWASLNERLSLKIRQCYRLTNYALNSRHGWALSDPVVRFGKALFVLSGELRVRGEAEAQTSIEGKVLGLFQLAARLAKRLGDEQRLAEAAASARIISEDRESASYRWMISELEQIKDPAIINATQQYLDRLDKHSRGEELPFTTIKTTTKQIIENLAYGLGIDLEDQNDVRAQLVRIGIQDYDPSRVLSKCEHIFITLIPNSVSEKLGLPSAAAKVLHCTKHRYAVGGDALDIAYERLSRQFCAKCVDSAPRDPGWVYSDEWQQRENQKHRSVVFRDTRHE